MNLDLSVLRIAALILKNLRRKHSAQHDELLRELVGRVGGDVEYIFVPALNLLYLLGKVEYYPKNDVIEYVRGQVDHETE